MKIKITNKLIEWGDADFIIYKDTLAEIKSNPVPAINYKQMESVSCVIAGISAHEVYPECTAELGFPLFSDNFVVFKNNELGRQLYAEFMEDKNITCILARRKIMPCLFPQLFKLHRDPAEQPIIEWGT